MDRRNGQPAGRKRDPRTDDRGGIRVARWTAMALLLTSSLFSTARAVSPGGRQTAPRMYRYEVVNVYPHDPAAFCQGLAYADGFLYEGTGEYGRSSLRQVELKSGKVLKHLRLSSKYFGEGIAVVGDEIIQLTWKRRVAFVYDKETFEPKRKLPYSGEGWGITSDGRRMIMSDGSATLRFLDPEDFQVKQRVTVRSGRASVNRLNELEYVRGEVYANVWGTDYIARISPKTGDVLGWIDLRGLLEPAERSSRDAVLNGIAFDEEGDRLFVTGKYWPKLFEIRVVPKD
jgi:glutamine cyclotransferase